MREMGMDGMVWGMRQVSELEAALGGGGAGGG